MMVMMLQVGFKFSSAQGEKDIYVYLLLNKTRTLRKRREGKGSLVKTFVGWSFVLGGSSAQAQATSITKVVVFVCISKLLSSEDCKI